MKIANRVLEALKVGDRKFKNPKELEDFFFDNVPHEIGWDEFKSINHKLFTDVIEAGKYLLASGKIKANELPKGYR